MSPALARPSFAKQNLGGLAFCLEKFVFVDSCGKTSWEVTVANDYVKWDFLEGRSSRGSLVRVARSAEKGDSHAKIGDNFTALAVEFVDPATQEEIATGKSLRVVIQIEGDRHVTGFSLGLESLCVLFELAQKQGLNFQPKNGDKDASPEEAVSSGGH